MRTNKSIQKMRYSGSQAKGKRIVSCLLVMIMVLSALIPQAAKPYIVDAKDATAKILIIGGTNRSMIAKSQKGVIYTYRSSNTKVATVSKNGVVTGVKKGKANIVRYRTQNRKTTIDKVQSFKVQKFAIKGKKTVYVNGKYTYKTNGTGVKFTLSKKKYGKITKKGVLKPKKAGSVKITAKCGKKKVTKKVTIKKDAIDHIEATYNATAYQGNSINPSDLSVTAVYKSGVKKVLDGYTLGQTSFGAAGEDALKITYGAFSTTIKIPVQQKTMTALQVSYTGASLAVGQTVSSNDFKVTGIYNDGSTRVIGVDELVFSNMTAQEKGTLAVVITHVESKLQTTVNINVDGLAITSVSASYDGGIIYKEDGVESSKIKILVTYEDGTTGLVDASDIRVGSVTNEDGTVSLLLYYTVDGMEYSTILSVEERSHKLVDLNVESERMYAYCGQELNRNNFLVKAVYSDGEEKIVDDWVSDYRVSDTEGTQVVRFQYVEDGITVTKDVELTVKDVKPIGIKVTRGINSVKQGDSLDLTQMEVTLYYEDDSSEIVNGFSTDYNREDATVGERNVTVSYGAFTATTKVQVEACKAVSISATNPTGITLAGGALNTTGIAVTALFDNGTSAVVDGWTTNYSSTIGEGTHAITISYGGLDCTVTVRVEAPLSVSASANSVIEKHPVTITCNHNDVTASLLSGTAVVSTQTGSVSVVPSTTAQVQIVRALTGETAVVDIAVTAFTMKFTNLNGGYVALGDKIQFTTNAPAQFSYRLTATTGKEYTATSSSSQTSYSYTTLHEGSMVVNAVDSVTGVTASRTVTVHKALSISGSSSVAVGKTITLSTTKTNVTWSSGNTKVATISAKGVVKGVKAGTVTITATFPDYANRTATKKITVTN